MRPSTIVLRNGLTGGIAPIVLSILAVSPLTAPVTGMKRRSLEVAFEPLAIPAAPGPAVRQEDR